MGLHYLFEETQELDRARKTASYIMREFKERPRVGVVLGSGWGEFVKEVKVEKSFNYAELQNFQVPSVKGHKGELLFARMGGLPAVILSGRIHSYEGYPLHQVTFPIRVLSQLGVEICVLTNASGGLNQTFRAGDTLLVTDHINLMGVDPLRGIRPAPERSPFLDQRNIYHPICADVVRRTASSLSIPLREGVYIALSGPCYETAAEVHMLRTLGGDAVGMSTVPEVIVAHRERLWVCTLSCIANVGSDMRNVDLDHESVLAVLRKGAKSRAQLLIQAIPLMVEERDKQNK
ncbi:MAG: purine-nucleoside phosphorylase [Deltaproteobacteria bacterium]|nr:purine-nucleoside phosphorylase [Deltaproteobacteria bacterium]